MALLPFSWVYAGLVWLRNWAYDAGLFVERRVGVPVISVGNMTAGGTGKTPFVELLIRRLLQRNQKVAVISRGYGRQSKGTVIVSDGRKVQVPGDVAGDEPYQIAKKFPSVVVVVDERRSRGARLAIEQFGVTAIVLDDGFQHRSLARECDIVMLNGATSLRHTRLLPSGLRRELMSGLQRADLLVCSEENKMDVLQEEIKEWSDVPIVSVKTVAVHLRGVQTMTVRSLQELKGSGCVAFCGIGNPPAFRETLERLGVTIHTFITYADHHRYSSADIERIIAETQKYDHALLITTEKDYMRLEHMLQESPQMCSILHVLEIETQLTNGSAIVDDCIDRTLKRVAA